MKKIYLLASCLLVTMGLTAQVQNGGFETWSGANPTGWENFNPLLPQVGALGATVTVNGTAATAVTTKETSSPIEGTSNAKIVTFTVAGLTGNYASFNGINSESLSQDVVTSNQYAGVAFAYKTTLTSGDASGIFVNATKNGAIVGQGLKSYEADAAGWVRDTIYLTYTQAPDTISILFASSLGTVITGASLPTPTVDGSTFEVDDVQFLPAPSATDFASTASNIVASDVADNANGLDLQVKFDAATDESTVTEYRVIAISTSFQLNNWSVAPVGTYKKVTPDGSANYTVTFDASSVYFKSIGGGSVQPNPIINGVAMDVYILSIAGGVATIDQVAGPSNQVTLGTLSVNELSKNNILVYPNPASNFVSFAWDNDVVTSVELYNTLGQKVMTVSASEASLIDLNSLNSGMYIYRVMNNNEVISTDKLQVIK